MPDYSKDNTGTLNRNDKGDNPKRPDWRGSATIDCKEYWISAWERTAQRGDNAGQMFLSLSIEPKQQQSAKPVAAHAVGDEADPF